MSKKQRRRFTVDQNTRMLEEARIKLIGIALQGDLVKRKLLFVGPYPPPYGGIASHLQSLLPELAREGYEVISLSPSSTERVVQSSDMTNRYFVPKRYFLRNPLKVLKAMFAGIIARKDMAWAEYFRAVNLSVAVSEAVESHQIDVVFMYEQTGLTAPFLRPSIPSTIPLVLMFFGEYYLDPDKFKRMPRFMDGVFGSYDVLLSSSQYCADSISKVFGYDHPVDVVYVGVDNQVFGPAAGDSSVRVELGIPHTAKVFLFLGRMVKDMGVDFLTTMADHLLALHPESYLIMAGAKGDLSPLVEDLAGRQKRVKYCPDVPHDQKVEMYRACDIVLAPTMERHACMGVSIKEAMLCGKPVIASSSGGIPEAIEDGVSGYVVPIVNGRVDSDLFLDRSRELVNDPSLLAGMGDRARMRALQMFTNGQTVEKYLQLIEDFYGESTEDGDRN
jgi:glycosyltransferase involved in cell wall biosynthesis